MSFKYQAQKVGDAHYVLPRCGSMKVEAHAFFSDDLYAASEESLWSQLANGASYDGIIGAYLMPDGHSGFGVPIGCVLVTENTIIQAGSGYDISCGIVCLRTELRVSDVLDFHKRVLWIEDLEKRIATGIGSSRPELMPAFSNSKVQEILRYGAKALGVPKDLCERQYIPVPDTFDFTSVPEAYDKILPQLGSVGSGNHFVELLVDELTGEVFVMIHCGSRGYGWKTANHFFYRGAELRGLPSNRREDSWLYMDEPLGKEYWAYHNSAANFAIANRHIIANGVREALQEVFNADSKAYYEISHNLVQEETLILPDGTTKRGYVHRKGATRAFPAGHPDLKGTVWDQTGHPCLIPGSMRDGAAILFSEPGAVNSAYSVNHGSGRKLPRGKAKRDLEGQQSQIDDDMLNIERTLGGVSIKGIATNNEHIPLDECCHVYKSLDEVLAVLVENRIARISNRLYPVANLKGFD
jgi:tRNA-splicing ligase RtcB